MQPMTHLFNKLANYVAVIAAVAVVIMMLHVTLDVLFRYFGGGSLTGTIAFVKHYYMVLVVCLPLAFVDLHDRHIAVDVLTDHMPALWQHHLRGWNSLIIAVVFGVLTYATWLEAMQKFHQKTYALENEFTLPIWIGYFFLPLGTALLSANQTLRFIVYLSSQNNDSDKPNQDHSAESV